MRRVVTLCLISFVVANSFSVSAREQQKALYSVVFPAESGLRIATLLDDGTWSHVDLPHAYAGQYSYGPTQKSSGPLWSPDGKKLYVTAFPPDDTVNPRSIYAYDMAAQQFTQVMESAGSCGDTQIRITAIESISPD